MHIQIGLSTFVNTNNQLLEQCRMVIEKEEWEIADNENTSHDQQHLLYWNFIQQLIFIENIRIKALDVTLVSNISADDLIKSVDTTTMQKIKQISLYPQQHYSRNKPYPVHLLNNNFSKLKSGQIGQCKLMSMECLTKLNTPLLRVLDMQMNDLTSIRPLRKCNFPRLISLGITQNYFNELTSLTYCNFPDLSFLSIEYLVLKKIGQELNWILKIQAKNMNIIRRLDQGRPNRDIIQNQIKQRYPNILLVQ